VTTTTKLALELLASNAANQTLANTTFAQLNQIVQAGVVDKDLATPPGSPTNEALYIVATGGTGAWASKDGQLAYWLTSTNAWQFIVPREGMFVHLNDEDVFYKYTGTVWEEFTSGGGVSLPVVQTFTGNKTLALTDINTYNVSQDGTAQTVTVPAQATVVWTADAEIHIEQGGTGAVTVTGATGVTVNGVSAGSFTLSGQFAAATLKRKGSDSWTLIFGSLDADLKALADNTTNGLWARTGAGTGAARTITGPAAGVTVANGDGVSGNPTLALANDLAALEGLGSTGIAVRTAADIWAQRTITGTANKVTVTNGDGVSGNPTLTIPDAVTLVTPTVTGLLDCTGGQIKFPAVQVPSADANTLDDYEEGTWTPTLTFSTPGDLSVVYSTRTASYTKIGRSINVNFQIVTSTFTHTTAAGTVLITGLPFTSNAISRGSAGFQWSGITKSGYTDVAIALAGSSSQFSFTAAASGLAFASVVAADMPSGGTVNWTSAMSYFE